MNKKGFTLMELLAVLTVLAIISLITIPIVANVVNSSREKAYVNSIQAYGKAVENAIAAKRAEKGTVANTIKDLEGYIQTSGNEVSCNNDIENTDDGIVLTGCKVLDSNEEQKSKYTYRYNKGKVEKEEEDDNYVAMITTYGKIVEGAVQQYKEQQGINPQTIQELLEKALLTYNGESNGDKVLCDNTIQYVEDTIKLTNCKVVNQEGQQVSKNTYSYSNGETKKDTTTAEDKTTTTTTTKVAQNLGSYEVGQTFTISGEDYYVISDSEYNEYVTLLKANPLTVAEVNTYGSGHVNRYASSNGGNVGTAYNLNGYGAMAYYRSETCGYINGSYVRSGCTTDYASSEVKYAVDAWAASKFTNGELSTDTNGYEARLITLGELTNLGYVDNYSFGYYPPNDNIPRWIWNSQYSYWTMSPYNSSTDVWFVNYGGRVDYCYVNRNGVVRPVINVYKSKLP